MGKAAAALLIGLLVSHLDLAQSAPAVSGDTAPPILVVLEGAIGPATSRYVEHALDEAARQQSPLVILQMDTPGGLDSSMRDIVKAILASPVPVAAYVAPSGARAASAGTYILYACHLAAMAPATNLGAATPVSIGGESSPSPPLNTPDRPAKGKAKEEAPAPSTTMERKVTNDAVAYIRSLAQLRGRNADWAESAVRGAASLSANDALAQHVIDLIAKDPADLLRQVDGRKLKVADRDIVLNTRDLTVRRIEPDWRIRLLSVLTHPTIAYGLLLIGLYGLLLEGYNPGAILPGVAGAIALLLALYGFELLSVNFAGLGLIALGVGLMITEFFVHAFGSLVIGGLSAFIIGSVMLFDTNAPGFEATRPLIIAVAVCGGLLALTIVTLAARARRRPVSTGVEAMAGKTAKVVSDFADEGVVLVGGERWNARTRAPLHAGQRVRILAVEGLMLSVGPLTDSFKE